MSSAIFASYQTMARHLLKRESCHTHIYISLLFPPDRDNNDMAICVSYFGTALAKAGIMPDKYATFRMLNKNI